METSEKILIVDDEPDFVEALSKTLKAKGYQVVTASSKAEAQEMMKAQPNLVVVGTLTPAGQAFSLHQWLIRNPDYKDVLLLVVDAPYEQRAVKGWRGFEAVQLESDAYVSKPIEPAALLLRIQGMLEQAPGKEKRGIRVLVVDDHTMVRDGICAVLSLQNDIEVVGEAVNGQEAIEKAQRLLPDIVLMDIVMPVMNGLEAAKRIRKDFPNTKVLILTQYDEEENMLVAKDTGANGFIAKRAASSDLVNGIKTVSMGKFFPAGFGEMCAT